MIEFQQGMPKCHVSGYGKTIIAQGDRAVFIYPAGYSEKARDVGIMIACPGLPEALA